ncbi:hypothetical protein [Deinococcus peraridilitoris]|uniref:Uncharacterized protein n=1 Tax=Deinococcus peraridilitoris (strain DSM 19664 / LMG 22246 / CIP 109416 / KR-200) TaxID=937777 RepID=L0A1X3_DEIPD|nr:hypothetical protein [Deinococcus peraridilitoris]AFZ67010.1 hypothetical protein Deipe_1469 [Deinococcus peraridilitoris DSM 19664]
MTQEAESVWDVLRRHPVAAQALATSLQHREVKKPRPVSPAQQAECPHCRAEGVTVTIREHTYTRRREDCCQMALYEAAESALRYSSNPSSDPDERVEAALRYVEIKERVRLPSLLTKLHLLEQHYATVDERQQGLSRPQGGTQ